MKDAKRFDYSDPRNKIINWVRTQLIGPAKSAEELLYESPLERYHTGILFPISNSTEGLDPASISDDDEECVGDDNQPGSEVVPAVNRRRYMPPSSVGFSFFVSGDDVRLQLLYSCAVYVYEGRETVDKYKRVALGGDTTALTFNKPDIKLEQHNHREKILDGRASIDLLWRRFQNGWIITVSLLNNQEIIFDNSKNNPGHNFNKDRIKYSLFQVELRCIIETGDVGAYPRVDYNLLDNEEQELELQYKNKHIYAIGHGVAVDWKLKNDNVNEIFTDFMPAVEVPQVTADVVGDHNRILNLAHLADASATNVIFDELEQFVESYSKWVTIQNNKINTLEPNEIEVAKRITSRMDETLDRMRKSVILLRTDSIAAESFRLANQAMFDQMQNNDLVKNPKNNNKQYSWRPFQLAFLLTAISSTINDEDTFRDTIDLIWFPTGGGKTEAYLGLIGFLIIWRRFKFTATGGGTAVLMRYTLRLLTAQQFLRATRMICALELIRRRTDSLKQGDPITIGMWVGSATSPNQFENAQKIIEQAKKEKVSKLQQLVLVECPWCNSQFNANDNYIATATEFNFRCTNKSCEFGRDGRGLLPCNVVDEALYKDPPTLLIATIDKFARLAWDERTNAFFGLNSNRPPELVIQDELHLIAGALGSVAGLYEAAIDTVLKYRGIRPKYIASTATIRMAAQQTERLYGRKLAVFPPTGLSSDDSYFARTVPLKERPGRMYIGYLAPMLDRQHCMAPLVGTLLTAPEAVFDIGLVDRDIMLEAWWTQVVYHGSLKGVGNSHNAFNIDVPDVIRRLIEDHKQNQKLEVTENTSEKDVELDLKKNATTYKKITRLKTHIAQLTSISSAEENAKTFSQLECQRGEAKCLDAVLATNMVSVGLDVARLALMIVNGQPLTTAEYIQASSRVGRSDVPGIVFTNYFRDQARSLSHYESFRPYHEAFYRFVEPTSVTPFTFQARTRALHAALVIAIRHSGKKLLANNNAGKFNLEDDYVRKVIEILKERCLKADSGRGNDNNVHIDRLADQWNTVANYCKSSKIQLNYVVPKKDKIANCLLYTHDDLIKGIWPPTLHSMRNVESTGLLIQL